MTDARHGAPANEPEFWFRDTTRGTKEARELGHFAAHQWAEISAYDEDAAVPAETRAAYLQPRNWHLIESETPLFAATPQLKDRRVGVALISDHEHPFDGAQSTEQQPPNPFGFDWPFPQRSTRVIDYRDPGRAALLASGWKVIDDLAGTYSLAIPHGPSVEAGGRDATGPPNTGGDATGATQGGAGDTFASRASGGGGRLALGYTWDGLRAGLLATLLSNINPQDVTGGGREGTECGVLGLRRDHHIEGEAHHGALHIREDDDITALPELSPFMPRVKTWLAPDTSVAGYASASPSEDVQWRPFAVMPIVSEGRPTGIPIPGPGTPGTPGGPTGPGTPGVPQQRWFRIPGSSLGPRAGPVTYRLRPGESIVAAGGGVFIGSTGGPSTWRQVVVAGGAIISTTAINVSLRLGTPTTSPTIPNDTDPDQAGDPGGQAGDLMAIQTGEGAKVRLMVSNATRWANAMSRKRMISDQTTVASGIAGGSVSGVSATTEQEEGGSVAVRLSHGGISSPGSYGMFLDEAGAPIAFYQFGFDTPLETLLEPFRGGGLTTITPLHITRRVSGLGDPAIRSRILAAEDQAQRMTIPLSRGRFHVPALTQQSWVGVDAVGSAAPVPAGCSWLVGSLRRDVALITLDDAQLVVEEVPDLASTAVIRRWNVAIPPPALDGTGAGEFAIPILAQAVNVAIRNHGAADAVFDVRLDWAPDAGAEHALLVADRGALAEAV